MGNCQAAEMAAAVVEYPGGRVERVEEVAVPAQRLMSLYPGYFVAMLHLQQPPPSSTFELLAADAPLRLGHRYRLLSFEEVLTCFSQGGGTYARPVISVTHTNQRLMKDEHQAVRQRRASSTTHVVKMGC